MVTFSDFPPNLCLQKYDSLRLFYSNPNKIYIIHLKEELALLKIDKYQI